MRAEVIIFCRGDGGELAGPPIKLPLAKAEFDLVNFLEDVGGWIFNFFTGDKLKVGREVVEALSKLGGDVKDFKNAEVSFGQGGAVPNVGRPVSYAIVYFHAWTGDDIKPSFGRVEPTGVIRDLGESRYTRGDFQYEYRFYIPFTLLAPGKYLFAFGTGDSGTIQDAAIGYTVGMEITGVAGKRTIAERYRELGGAAGFLGQPTAEEQEAPDRIGRYRHFKGGTLYWCPGREDYEVHGAIREKWASLGWERGLLGYPISDESATPDGTGRYNHFQGGSVYWTPETGAWEVHGGIRERWAELGWERSYLGYPISDESEAPDGSRYTNFQNGSIRWTPKLGAEDSRAQVRLRAELIGGPT